MPHACASHYIKDMQGQGQSYSTNKKRRWELFPATASGQINAGFPFPPPFTSVYILMT